MVARRVSVSLTAEVVENEFGPFPTDHSPDLVRIEKRCSLAI